MVARGVKRVSYPFEYALLIMPDKRSLSVHDLISPDDPAAETITDTLVPQADSQNRLLFIEFFYQITADAAVLGPARARRDNDLLKL
jgi:hypothetical protein